MFKVPLPLWLLTISGVWRERLCGQTAGIRLLVGNCCREAGRGWGGGGQYTGIRRRRSAPSLCQLHTDGGLTAVHPCPPFTGNLAASLLPLMAAKYRFLSTISSYAYNLSFLHLLGYLAPGLSASSLSASWSF